MQIKTTRHVSLPLSPKKCWRTLQHTKAWNQFFPEIDHAVILRSGQVKLAMRLGNRRRFLKAQVQRDNTLRSLCLTSACAEIDFRLSAQVQADGPNSQICIDYQFSPPERWISFSPTGAWNRKRAGLQTTGGNLSSPSSPSKTKAGFASGKRILWGLKFPRLIRVFASFLLFALSALGIRVLPDLALPNTLAALAYTVLGMSFLVAVALLSGRHRERLLPASKAIFGKTRGCS